MAQHEERSPRWTPAPRSGPRPILETGIGLWLALEWMQELCGPEWPRVFGDWLWQHRDRAWVTVTDLRQLVHMRGRHRSDPDPWALRYRLALHDILSLLDRTHPVPRA